VQAVSVLPDDKIGYRRNYGTIDAPGGLVTVFDGLINCNRWHASASGYVDGRGTYRLRSHLAGAAQDIPGITAEIQLACPPPELVGPCDDGGADAGEDAPEEDVTDGDVVVVPDVTVTDVITDVPTHADTVDVGRADAPRTPVDAPGRSDDAQGSADASSDAGSDGSGETKDVATSTPDSAGPNVDAAAPPSDDPDSDRGSCSCSAPGDARSRKQTGWLIGGLIGMGVAFRRKYARRGEG
jgi:hypothetical protein